MSSVIVALRRSISRGCADPHAALSLRMRQWTLRSSA
jgi:hypothetical protein